MNKGLVWLTFALLISSVFILVSCAPASVSSPATPPPATSGPTSTGTPTQQPSSKPQYGGVFTAAINADTANWDPTTGFDLLGFQISITNEALAAGDWAKGPAGTGETDWQYGAVGKSSLSTGLLAESWEVPNNETLIFHIRKGVHWWNKAPANGREFTAEDAAWNIKTQWDLPGGNFQNFFPPAERLISVKATDKYTVELKFPLNTQGTHFWENSQRCYMMLPELYPKQKDWHNALGTGPFMVTDYVPATSITLNRNPNYWQTDPVGPGKGSQLPYLDGIKFLVIPDLSTRLAAFRTGKIDVLPATVWEDWQSLVNTMPYKPEYAQTFGANFLPTGREDKNLPFNDVRVRQAMNLAVDKQAIVDGYYQGHAALLGWPYYNTPAYKDLYMPLDQMPADVQELVKGGNPTKAKQLLAEAGYPNGFKTQIVCQSGGTDADFLSIIKQDLSKVGIDMEIKVVEPGVLRSIERARTWDEMFYKATKQFFLPHYMFEMRPESNDCAAFWDSPETRAVKATIDKNMVINDQAWQKALKDITPFVLQQSFAIWVPVAYKYNMWQPWVKNYYGCTTMGAMLPNHAQDYTWIDQNLKKSLSK